VSGSQVPQLPKDYAPVLEAAFAVIPHNCDITLLADRKVEHGKLICWLQVHQWSWAIRAKSDLKITPANAQTEPVANLLPAPEQADLFNDMSMVVVAQGQLNSLDWHAQRGLSVLQIGLRFSSSFLNHLLWGAQSTPHNKC
jgi:hypothetical protein